MNGRQTVKSIHARLHRYRIRTTETPSATVGDGVHFHLVAIGGIIYSPMAGAYDIRSQAGGSAASAVLPTAK